MRPFSKNKRELRMERMFETRSEAWEAVGLTIEVNQRAVRKARRELLVLVPLIILVIAGRAFVIDHNEKYPGTKFHPVAKWLLGNTPVTVVAVIAILVLGWMFSRDLARIAPTLFKRMDPATAGTVEFLIRLASVTATILAALGVAGIQPQTLAVGGAFTAVVLGLAAQQTLGNLFAGMVLLSARPFRLGERVRLQAGVVGGTIEGVVSSLGLLYTTLSRGEDRVMIPNNVVLAAAVVPLREPEAVDVKVRLASGIRPSQVQAILDDNISTEMRAPASVLLEEIDGDEVVIRVQATPERAVEGAQLADEMIAALASVTGEHALEHD
jgi:small conductance mechanosensitive channel